MQRFVDDFVLDNVMNRETGSDGLPWWWAPVLEGDEGYIVLWSDGTHHHTYRYPPDVWDTQE